jgi:hypothetical protein
MRIDNPDWVAVDHVTHESIGIDVAMIVEQQLPGLQRAMTVREIGRHPTMLSRLDQRMAPQSKVGGWTARLWSVAPLSRVATQGEAVAGWSDSDPDQPIGELLDSWQLRMARPITNLLLTWRCPRVPHVEELVDLRATAVPTTAHGTRVTAQIMGRLLAVRRYQHLDQPPVQAAYDQATRTLFLVSWQGDQMTR